VAGDGAGDGRIFPVFGQEKLSGKEGGVLEMRGVVHNQNQSSIFDAIATHEAAEAGIDLAAENNRPLLGLARRLAAELGRRQRFVTADDVQRVLLERNRLERSEGFIGCVRSGTRNMIDWFEIASGDSVYQIRRFETFWFCSCPGFTFSKTCCKHIAFIQLTTNKEGN
jgi:hypothetical protein